MNKAETPDDAVPHPRHTAALYGHREAEAMLLAAYRGGASGVGKATLA